MVPGCWRYNPVSTENYIYIIYGFRKYICGKGGLGTLPPRSQRHLEISNKMESFPWLGPEYFFLYFWGHIIFLVTLLSHFIYLFFFFPTSDHGVAGSNPTGCELLPEPKRRFIAQSLSCSPFHRLEMTEILLKGRKTLTHQSIIHIIFFLHIKNPRPLPSPTPHPLQTMKR